MIARILNRFAARRLAKRGATIAHNRILDRAAQIRRELGLPPHPALGSG